MGTSDPAQDIKNALAAHWASVHPTWKATLHVDDDWAVSDINPQVLVANDGGPRVFGGPWLVRKDLRRPTMRLTAFAKGRPMARSVIDEAVDWILANKITGIARVEDISEILITRDRDTGAYLASVTMPVIVKPIAA